MKRKTIASEEHFRSVQSWPTVWLVCHVLSRCEGYKCHLHCHFKNYCVLPSVMLSDIHSWLLVFSVAQIFTNASGFPAVVAAFEYRAPYISHRGLHGGCTFRRGEPHPLCDWSSLSFEVVKEVRWFYLPRTPNLRLFTKMTHNVILDRGVLFQGRSGIPSESGVQTPTVISLVGVTNGRTGCPWPTSVVWGWRGALFEA